MLHILKDLRGLSIASCAQDGHVVGEVKDVLFDDLALTIRYFVVKTGHWLSGRQVLLSPQAVQDAHPENGTLITSLSKEQIKASPALATDPPVSRQYEEILSQHYDWQPYWSLPMTAVYGIFGAQIPPYVDSDGASRPHVSHPASDHLKGDPHLQSAVDVAGYTLHALDGDIGHVKDFLVDMGDWHIRYLVVETGSWLARRKVLIDHGWIRKIEWAGRDIVVALRRRDIENAPEYDPDAMGTKYESDLTIYYKGILDQLRHPFQADKRPGKGPRETRWNA